MDVKPGQFIESTSFLVGTIFENCKILICAINSSGAWGFVMNQLFPRTLNELEEFKDSISIPLYEGGPVEKEKLFFIHQRPDLILGGISIDDTYYFGGDFQKAVELINSKKITSQEIKLFLGYCGWNDNELQEEIVEGSWVLVN